MSSDYLTSLGITSCLLYLTLAILIYFWLTSEKEPQNLPPTPGIELPFIGHLYLLKKNPRQQFLRYTQTLGPIFRLKMGSWTTVVLNSFDVIKEATVKQGEYFSDRPNFEILISKFPHLYDGIVMSSGARWKQIRTTSLAILRSFGMGKNIMTEHIANEVAAYVKELESTKGRPINVKILTNMSVANVICSVIFGQRFEITDPIFLRLIEMYDHVLGECAGINAVVVLPVLRHLPFDVLGYNKYASTVMEINSVIKHLVQKVRDRSTNEADNFVAAYVEEMKKAEQLGESTYLDEANLIGCIDNLFAAGTETTSTTILWSLLYVLHNPETQKKIFNEIMEHVGTDRAPNIYDKPKLKYLNAFIMETQRTTSLLPLSLPHACNQDTVLLGFNIPKGTQILINLDSVLRDEKIWGDPENFRPERFLDEQGNLIKREELIPFSIGRRICLGESLAKMELFLFLSSMFQRFEFLPADPDHLPTLNEIFGTTTAPNPYEIRCVDRQKC
ncbi:cytochrome P450 2U1-like [Physella acuta]|uniref:cytochrome P450 2U1-like n=1 Tax=Physella acuta TaxID=109671 RepID=UPI0027DDEF01|nr:cytochrome P450 2U1-like [Physella acuta]